MSDWIGKSHTAKLGAPVNSDRDQGADGKRKPRDKQEDSGFMGRDGVEKFSGDVNDVPSRSGRSS